MSTKYDYFYKQFVAQRIKLGLTQEQAAESCGVGRQMWGKYERGDTYPSSEVLLKFKEIGADVSILFANDDNIKHVNQELASYGLNPINVLNKAYDDADDNGKQALLSIAKLILDKCK